MNDPDHLACPSCLHDVRSHSRDGCAARDEHDNRCACPWTGVL